MTKYSIEEPVMSSTSSPTAKQRRLLKRLIAELEEYQAFEAATTKRKAARAKTVKEASDLIDKTIRVLREYQHEL